ncbi:MAG: class I SAM-dependent methyltransferase [Wenzhouxiangella sp.]
MSPTCPVCTAGPTRLLLEAENRRYWRCANCQASFLDPAQRPSSAVERAEYDRHQNRVDDAGYRRFLQPAADALSQRVRPGAEVLDYGCGPGPALADMLRRLGYRTHLYDPFYHPQAAALTRRYAAITCTEVVEHFHQPDAEFQRLDKLLEPDGWLIVMTRFQTEDARFARWHYRRDPTHVVFYRPATFELIAQRYGWFVECRPPQLALMRKLRQDANTS